MPTPHNAAAAGDIAKVVLMPGDPLRARFVAERYLTNATCFNTIRGMLGFTGFYQGVRVSVMGSGMGVPSMGIYSHELYNIYDVDAIVRIGSAGGIAPGVGLRDIVVAQAACTDSNFAHQFDLPGTMAPIASFDLLNRAVAAAGARGAVVHVGNVVTSDVFYTSPNAHRAWAAMGCLAVEMETAGLYLNAASAGKRALAMFTVSDLPISGEGLGADERERDFGEMIEVALDVAVAEGR